MNSTDNIRTHSQGIFRINALESTSTPREVSVSLKIIHPAAWLWIIAVFLALTGLIIWSLFGTVSLTVSATGIIMPDANQMISITGTSAGTVSEVNVSQGQQVTRGEVLARVSNPVSQEEIWHSKKTHAANAIALSIFMENYKSREKELFDQFSARARALTSAIKNNRKMISTLHHLLHAREKLYRQGYLSRIELEKSRLEYFLAKEKLSSLKNELTEIGSAFGATIQTLQDKRMDLNRQCMESLHAQRQKEMETKMGSAILSPADGTLTGVYISQGEYFIPKKPAFTLSAHQKGSSLRVLTFVSAADGKSVIKGMRARVFSDSLYSHEQGHIPATVSAVSDYPITKETAALYLGNQAIVDTFFRYGAPFLAELSFQTGTVTATAGTMTRVKIITHRYTPIRLLMRHLQH